MIGIEKVTSRIIADAEADARATAERANAECDRITKKYEAEFEADRERMMAEAEAECAVIINRAKSTAALYKRNAALEAKNRRVNAVYARAFKEISGLPPAEYRRMLISMLKYALRQQLDSENESMKLYGEDVAPAYYEIILNARDQKNHGQALIDAVSEFTKIGLKDSSRVKLAKQTVEMTGGIILKCGDIEINCSLETLFAQVRGTTERRVADILFGDIS